MRRFLFLFAFLIGKTSYGQQDTIRNIVFEGAGIRGIAYCGVINVLEKKNLLPGIKRVGGTSAGAITALCLSLSYRSEEIQQLINSTSFKSFNDGRFFFFGGINRVIKYYGWYRGKSFEKWLSKIIKIKAGSPDITFRQLHERGFKDLFITGTNLTKQQAVVFSYESFPDMRVRDAVRISMSIPIYFEAVFMDSTGRIVTHPSSKKALSVMADGGIISNFPIRIFDSTKYIDPKMQNSFTYNNQTIGFRIDRKEQIENDRLGRELASFTIGNLTEYMNAFYSITIEKLNRQPLTDKDWRRSISIDDGGIQPRIRKMKKKEIDLLFNNGQESALRYLEAAK